MIFWNNIVWIFVCFTVRKPRARTLHVFQQSYIKRREKWNQGAKYRQSLYKNTRAMGPKALTGLGTKGIKRFWEGED